MKFALLSRYCAESLRYSKTSNPHGNFEVDVNLFDSTDKTLKARKVT